MSARMLARLNSGSWRYSLLWACPFSHNLKSWCYSCIKENASTRRKLENNSRTHDEEITKRRHFRGNGCACGKREARGDDASIRAAEEILRDEVNALLPSAKPPLPPFLLICYSLRFPLSRILSWPKHNSGNRICLAPFYNHPITGFFTREGILLT